MGVEPSAFGQPPALPVSRYIGGNAKLPTGLGRTVKDYVDEVADSDRWVLHIPNIITIRDTVNNHAWQLDGKAGALQNEGMDTAPYNMSDEAVGLRLRTLRLAMKFRTQIEFAKKLDMTQPQYNQYETGARPLPKESALKIKLVTGASIDWLLTGDPAGMPVDLFARMATPPSSSSGKKRAGRK